VTTFSGREALVAVKDDNTVSYTDAQQVQSVSFDFDGSLEDIYQLGSRDPQEIKEGTIAISGTLERLFESGNFSAMGTSLLESCKGNPLTWYRCCWERNRIRNLPRFGDRCFLGELR